MLESGTALTSPYGTQLKGYVASVVYPECAKAGGVGCSQWDTPCSDEFCFGVPLYREYLNGAEDNMSPKPTEFIRMAGSAIYQRETMIVNHGHYYIDTTTSVESQKQLPGVGERRARQSRPLRISDATGARPDLRMRLQGYRLSNGRLCGLLGHAARKLRGR